MESITNDYFYQMIHEENIDEIRRCCEVLSVNDPIPDIDGEYILPIFYSVFGRLINSFKVLLELGADINSVHVYENLSCTLLSEVIDNGIIEFFKILAERKPQFSYRDLAICLVNFSTEDLESLDINWTLTNSYGNNIFSLCFPKRSGIVQFLISKGVNCNKHINSINNKKFCVLFWHMLKLRYNRSAEYYFEHIRDLINYGKIVKPIIMHLAINDSIEFHTSLNLEQQKYLLDASNLKTIFSKRVYILASIELKEYIDIKRSNYFSFLRSVSCFRKACLETIYKPGGI